MNNDTLDPYFALFNCHINNADIKAKNAFIQKFGPIAFQNEIDKFYSNNIMDIFNSIPNKYTEFYVSMVQIFVNEDKILNKSQEESLNQLYQLNQKTKLQLNQKQQWGKEQ